MALFRLCDCVGGGIYGRFAVTVACRPLLGCLMQRCLGALQGAKTGKDGAILGVAVGYGAPALLRSWGTLIWTLALSRRWWCVGAGVSAVSQGSVCVLSV
jgi:hypothetical protein